MHQQLRFLIIMLIFFLSTLVHLQSAVAAIPATEREALIALYNSTDGDNSWSWDSKSGWKEPPLDTDGFAMPGTENTWHGVTCDAANTSVQIIEFDGSHQSGSIPAELGNLSNLQQLILRYLDLTGSIPVELGNLSDLQTLDLEGSDLAGGIPPELGNLSNLQSLSLASNNLTGSIPAELGNLSNLQYLNLDWNTSLTGSIPAELGNLGNLQELYLRYTSLTGSIPAELGNLSNLQYLDITEADLTGSIPAELGNLGNLQGLELSYTSLTGSIPAELGNLSNLQSLWLSGNDLTGGIPAELGNLSNLEYLRLNRTQLSGSIPPELGDLANLQWLYLYSNQLSGSIPSELGNLANLQWLDLHSNQLSGRIPVELMNMSSLSDLDICGNHLYATDPDLRDFLDNLQPGWEDCQTLADSYEPDNSHAEANTISPAHPQTHSIVPATDQDWVYFTLSGPSDVAIETSGADFGDTRMWLFESDGTTLIELIEYNDNGGAVLFSKIDRLQAHGDELSAGIYYVKIDEFGNNNSIGSYDITLTVFPDINVRKGTTSIPDNTGSYDFGSVEIGSSAQATFTIENNGTANLNLTGNPHVQLAGSQEFQVTQQPATPVPASSSVEFSITFTPTQTATTSISAVYIDNNDPDEDPYNFSISGNEEPIIRIVPTSLTILEGEGIAHIEQSGRYHLANRNQDKNDKTPEIFSNIQVGEEVHELYEVSHPLEGAGIVWEKTFHWPNASYISIHFVEFDLAAGAYVEVSSPDLKYRYLYKGKGKVVREGEAILSTFWATHIPGNTAIVRLYMFNVNVEGERGFAIDKWARGYEQEVLPDLLEIDDKTSIEAICGNDDKKWASCYDGTNIYEKSRTVARLLINGTSACTGWLLGSAGHLMTNNHCIESQSDADNTDYEFMAEGATCTTDCSGWFACPGTVAASSGTLVRTDSDLDYALVLLPANLAPTYGYLQLRETLPRVGERIYIPQHPSAEGKQIAVVDDQSGGYCEVHSTDEPPCTGGPGDIGYYADTEGGSSGSPVLAYSDHLVVALHHCANCPNRGVPIPDIIADLGSDLPANAIGGDGYTFAIYNDGTADLEITSMTKRDGDAWLTWTPTAPLTIAPGGSQIITVGIDWDQVSGISDEEQIIVYSNDSDKSPYPNAVFVNARKPNQGFLPAIFHLLLNDEE